MPTTYKAATDKQVAFIQTLIAERTPEALAEAIQSTGVGHVTGQTVTATLVQGISSAEASALITELLDQPKAPKAKGKAAPALSLTEMAQAIETGAPVVAAQPEQDYEAVAAEVLVFTREECKALRSAISVCIGETDGTAMDHALYERIDAFLGA